MRLILIISFFVVLGCTKKTETRLLQEKEIALAQPKVSSTSAIIDSSVVVTAALKLDGVEIFYTDDGSEPTIGSMKYEKPFRSKSEGIYTFKAFHPSWKSSDITILKLYKKGIVPSNIEWHTSPNNAYEGLGTSTVINQEKAGLNFRNMQWVGFDSTAIADVHFKKKRFIESINIGYLVDVASWIFPPASVRISSDEMDTIEIEVPRLNQQEPKALRDVQVPIGKELSSIHIEIMNLNAIPDWHDGKGNKAWLFMDEWIFK